MFFLSGALDVDDDVRLDGARGSERISHLFEWKLLLVRPNPFTDEDLDGLTKSECAIAIGARPGDIVFGRLSDIQVLDAHRKEPARYVATMVPNAWALTLTQTNRIFQETTVPKMVEEILTLYGMKKGQDFDILIAGAVATHEYVVQYEESDWDFLQRWLEHEGYFYWFEHGENGEKLLIADNNDDTSTIEDPKILSFRERGNLSSGGVTTVWDLEMKQRTIPARVALVDYNYRTPHVPMMVKADVDAQRGFGTMFLYGEHFKDTNRGNVLAKARVERLACRRRTFTGATDCSRFRVGHSFELENAVNPANDREYLITAIEHRVGVDFGDDGEKAAGGKKRYSARFEAIPLDVPFRPERVTPWPSIHGVMHAHIDADGSGETAQIDDQGRYKVRLPFDAMGQKGAKASRWIRMAQPYAGAGYGSHFPLHKGAEVLLAHLDGDPDRPIIVGSVPNPHTVSPSTSTNATQSVIQTASGIRIEMEDQQG